MKSEGDYEAGKNLVETYGVKVNQELHKEVLNRFAGLNLKAYKGFIQPRLVPVMKDGKIADVKIEYPTSRSEEHTSELQSLMRISYAVFCLKKHKKKK